MIHVIVVIVSIVLMSCTSSPQNEKTSIPKNIMELQDDDSYIVYTLNEVGGDEFRPPYLECVESTLFGSDVKELWEEQDFMLGKCPNNQATKGNTNYTYIAYCERLRFHVYKSEADQSSSLNEVKIKEICRRNVSK